MRVLAIVSTRTYWFKYAYLLKWVRCTHCNKYEVLVSAKSPVRAILLQSPGRKPWVNRFLHLLSSFRSGTPPTATQQWHKPNECSVVPLLRSSIRFCLCLPRVAYRALPSFHPGLCRSVVPTALVLLRVSYYKIWYDCSVWKQGWAYVKLWLHDLFSKPRRSLYKLQP